MANTTVCRCVKIVPVVRRTYSMSSLAFVGDGSGVVPSRYTRLRVSSITGSQT